MMSRLTFAPAILALFLLFPLVQGQFVASLSQCVQDCVKQSQDENCKASDLKCLCRASAGNFLPSTITCMHGSCDNDLDNSQFLTPIQLACEIAGVPIPDSAIKNAENEASSYSSGTITTVTTTAGSSSVSAVTVTSTQDGSTVAIIYPVTIKGSKTVSGSPSTLTITTTSSDPSSSGASESSTTSSTTTTTTPVAASEAISSSASSSKTSSASSSDEMNSSPFQNSNDAADGSITWRVLEFGLLCVLGYVWL